MDVTVVGTGSMARAIAARVLAGNHSVTLHGRTREKAETLDEELVKLGLENRSVSVGVVGGEIGGEVVVLAVWYDDVGDVLTAYGDRLAGRILVDITNPIDRGTFEPLGLAAGSAAQEIAAAAPPGVRVVKAFNTTFAGTLMEGEVADETLDVFVAADDDDAKWTVTQLVEDAGLRAIDVGPLRRAQQLEALGYLHMAIQGELGTEFASTLKILA